MTFIQSFALSGAQAFTRLVSGNAPKLNHFDGVTKGPYPTRWGGIFGYADYYCAKTNRITGPFEAIYKQPGATFRTAAALGILTITVNSIYKRGITTILNDLVFSNKSYAQLTGEYLAGASITPMKDFGWGFITGAGSAVYELFKQFKESATEQATQQGYSFFKSSDQIHTLSTLRYSQACMQSDVCSEIVSQIDHSASHSYILPGALLLAALSASACYYSTYAMGHTESTSDSTQPPPTTTPAA